MPSQPEKSRMSARAGGAGEQAVRIVRPVVSKFWAPGDGLCPTGDSKEDAGLSEVFVHLMDATD